jgi:two-component system, chemotaxis family, response regulator PixG
MLTPSSVRIVEPPIGTYKVEIADELEKHIKVCIQARFTGRLDLILQESQNPQWSLFFHLGFLTWSASELHPTRRWSRLLRQHCPQLAVGSVLHQGSNRPRYYDYDSFSKLVRQREIQPRQLEAIALSNNIEILFDIIQAIYQLRHSPGLQLLYRQTPKEMAICTPISIRADQAWLQAWQLWRSWLQAGLAGVSPNLAPVIRSPDELQQQTSRLVYQNLTMLADGHWTIRDLSVKLQQPMLVLTESIAPYINQGMMGLSQVADLSYSVQPIAGALASRGVRVGRVEDIRSSVQSVKGALVAYVDDSRFDSATMGHILNQAGYRFVNIPDSTQALPMLLDHKPDLIFLDLLMPVANGYEVCTQIRRVSAFKNTPVIIVTSSDGLVDRVRAKLAGSSGFIAKPISAEKVLPALQQYLLSGHIANPND